MKKLLLSFLTFILVIALVLPINTEAAQKSTDNSSPITTENIIKQFKTDGLEVGAVSDLPNKEFGNGRKEGNRILIPSLGEDAGGRLFIFNDAKSLAQAKGYYDGLSSMGPLFYSHTHQNGLILLQMNGNMSDADFKKYADSIDAVVSGKNANTTSPAAPTKKGEMKVHFIDVGQGDSILIQSHDGKNILVDGGPKSAGKTVVNYLKSKGVKKLDYVVATHPDADHVGGLIAVLNSISVGKFVNSGKSHTTETYTQLLKLVEQKNIKYIEPKIGEILIGDWTSDFYLQSLYSDAKAVDTNDASIVLKTGYKNVEFLLMADASKDLEELLTNSFDSLNVQILKAGHHGSNTSTSSKFLNAVKPEVTILSYGKDNSYGHPNNEVLNNLKSAGSKVYSTAQDGTIVIKTNGKTYNVAAKEFNVPESKPSQQKPETKPTEPVKESFKNCSELRAVYPGGVMSGHPAYELQHDADNDGWACEPVVDNHTEKPTTTPITTPSEPSRESFKNCTELRKVYPNGVDSSHPAYEKKHDRDGDGWACER